MGRELTPVELRELSKELNNKEVLVNYLSRFKNSLDEDVNNYLVNYAINYEENDIARTTLLFDEESEEFVGYFSIGINVICYNEEIEHLTGYKRVQEAYEHMNLFENNYHPIYKLIMIGKNEGSTFKNFLHYTFEKFIWKRLAEASKYVGTKVLYLDCVEGQISKMYSKEGFKEFEKIPSKNPKDSMIRMLQVFSIE